MRKKVSEQPAARNACNSRLIGRTDHHSEQCSNRGHSRSNGVDRNRARLNSRAESGDEGLVAVDAAVTDEHRERPVHRRQEPVQEQDQEPHNVRPGQEPSQQMTRWMKESGNTVNFND